MSGGFFVAWVYANEGCPFSGSRTCLEVFMLPGWWQMKGALSPAVEQVFRFSCCLGDGKWRMPFLPQLNRSRGSYVAWVMANEGCPFSHSRTGLEVLMLPGWWQMKGALWTGLEVLMLPWCMQMKGALSLTAGQVLRFFCYLGVYANERCPFSCSRTDPKVLMLPGCRQMKDSFSPAVEQVFRFLRCLGVCKWRVPFLPQQDRSRGSYVTWVMANEGCPFLLQWDGTADCGCISCVGFWHSVRPQVSAGIRSELRFLLAFSQNSGFCWHSVRTLVSAGIWSDLRFLLAFGQTSGFCWYSVRPQVSAGILISLSWQAVEHCLSMEAWWAGW